VSDLRPSAYGTVDPLAGADSFARLDDVCRCGHTRGQHVAKAGPSAPTAGWCAVIGPDGVCDCAGVEGGFEAACERRGRALVDAARSVA
jgi:hypothetical protein